MGIKTEFIPLSLEALPLLAAEKKAEGWRFVQILAVNTDQGVDLIYSFMKDGVLANHRIEGVEKGLAVPSITDKFLAAFVFENEVHDLFGVDVKGIAIDFGGNFYALAHKQPMTVISPEQKAARDKAAKIAASKAEKERAAASANAAFVSEHPDAQPPAPHPGPIARSDPEGAERRFAGTDPEKVARLRADVADKARKAKAHALDPDAPGATAEGDEKAGSLGAEKPRKELAPQAERSEKAAEQRQAAPARPDTSEERLGE